MDLMGKDYITQLQHSELNVSYELQMQMQLDSDQQDLVKGFSSITI